MGGRALLLLRDDTSLDLSEGPFIVINAVTPDELGYVARSSSAAFSLFHITGRVCFPRRAHQLRIISESHETIRRRLGLYQETRRL
jgi:hypothetical protein